jgi:hypothetical protein
MMCPLCHLAREGECSGQLNSLCDGGRGIYGETAAGFADSVTTSEEGGSSGNKVGNTIEKRRLEIPQRILLKNIVPVNRRAAGKLPGRMYSKTGVQRSGDLLLASLFITDARAGILASAPLGTAARFLATPLRSRCKDFTRQ